MSKEMLRSFQYLCRPYLGPLEKVEQVCYNGLFTMAHTNMRVLTLGRAGEMVFAVNK